MLTTHELGADKYANTANYYDTQNRIVHVVGSLAGADTRPEFLDLSELPPSKEGEHDEPA